MTRSPGLPSGGYWLRSLRSQHILGLELRTFTTRHSQWSGGGGSVSAAFDVNMGVKQGYPASPRMFCLFFDRVQDFIAAHTPPSHLAHIPFLALLTTFILLYADDVVLIADSPERIKQLLHAFTHFADANGMHIS